MALVPHDPVVDIGCIVEHGRAAEVVGQVAHPYAAARLAAQPGRGPRPRAQVAVRGESPSPPDMVHRPAHCKALSRGSGHSAWLSRVCAASVQLHRRGLGVCEAHPSWWHLQ